MSEKGIPTYLRMYVLLYLLQASNLSDKEIRNVRTLWPGVSGKVTYVCVAGGQAVYCESASKWGGDGTTKIIQNNERRK